MSRSRVALVVLVIIVSACSSKAHDTKGTNGLIHVTKECERAYGKSVHLTDQAIRAGERWKRRYYHLRRASHHHRRGD